MPPARAPGDGDALDHGLGADAGITSEGSLREHRSAVDALLEAAEEEDGYPALSERTTLLVAEPPAPGRLFLVARAAGEALAGISFLEDEREADEAQDRADASGARSGTGRRSWILETAVHPRHRHRNVFERLLERAISEVAQRGGGTMRAWHRGAADGGEQAMARAGFEPYRELLQLRAPLSGSALEVTAPPLTVRPFHVGRDEEAWLATNGRAFARHPEQGSWTPDDLLRREREPWFDPTGFLVHEGGGRIAAFCWTKVHLHPLLGEIYVIGVDPDFQGRGLGRALTHAGLVHLAARGIPTAMLYVDGANTAALVLYRSLGFAEHHRETAYRAEVAAGPPGAQAPLPTARPTA